MTSIPTLELLPRHAGCLRKLARDLVVDESAADDLVQRTWVAALLHPPRRPGNLRAWLERVLRNFARRERRDAARREAGERGAPFACAPAAAELAERQELLRDVADAVLGLAEPYRSTIFLRYYEGLSPSAIARRDGVSLNTVKSRLGRGLGKLREGLDRRHGDRDRWRVGLCALIPAARWSGWPLVSASAVLAAGMVLLMQLVPAGGEAPDQRLLDEIVSAVQEQASPDRVVRHEDTGRNWTDGLAADRRSAPREGSSARVTLRVRDLSSGKLLDRFSYSSMVSFVLEGRRFSTSAGSGEADSEETVAWLGLPDGEGPHGVRLCVRVGTRKLWRLLCLRAGEATELEIPCRGGGKLRGRITDASGTAVQGAFVRGGGRVEILGDEPFNPFLEKHATGAVRSDVEGFFELPADHGEITAWHPDLSAVTVPVAAAHHIVLPPRVALHGRLLDAEGAPRAGVAVRLDRLRWTRTDGEGRFGFEGVQVGVRGIDLPRAGQGPGSISPDGGGPWVLRVAPGAGAELVLAPGLPEVAAALRSGARPFESRARGGLVGLDSPGGLVALSGRGAERLVRNALPGRYLLVTRGGPMAFLQIAGARVEVELGEAELRIEARPGRRLYLLPEGADELVRLMIERTDTRVVPEEGCVVYRPLPAGRYAVVADDGQVLTRLELPPRGLTIEIPD